MAKRKNRTNTIYYKIANAICCKHGIEEDTKYLAMFLDMMAFQIFETILILLISSIIGIFTETILVMIFFIIARVGHKGKHADSMAMCTVYSTLLIVGTSYMASLINPLISPIFGYILGIVMRDRRK